MLTQLEFFLIDLKIDYKVSKCIGMPPVPAFFNQTTHLKVMTKEPKVVSLLIISGGAMGSVSDSWQSQTRNLIGQYAALGRCPLICIGVTSSYITLTGI